MKSQRQPDAFDRSIYLNEQKKAVVESPLCVLNLLLTSNMTKPPRCSSTLL